MPLRLPEAPHHQLLLLLLQQQVGLDLVPHLILASHRVRQHPDQPQWQQQQRLQQLVACRGPEAAVWTPARRLWV